MAASYPSSAKTFTTKANGAASVIDASHVNDLQLEVTAVEQDLIAGLPLARGGTGLTAIGAVGTVMSSNGAVMSWGAGATEQTTALTGAQADVDLTGPNVFLRCTGAAPAFSGFTVAGATPYAGCRVMIECLGTTAQVTHQGLGSTAANRVICPSTAGQIVGVNGRMLLVYDVTTGRWRESVIDLGAPIARTFAAGDFTANGTMTWTVASGDVITHTYSQRGKQVTITINTTTTTVAGVLNTQLLVALPSGFTSTRKTVTIGLISDNGTFRATWVEAAAAGTTIVFYKDVQGGNWAASTDNSGASVVLTLEVD